MSSTIPLIPKANAEVSKNQIFTLVVLTVAFAFARTAVFIQVRTKLMLKDNGLSAIPLSFLYFGATFVAPFAAKFMFKVGRQKGFITGCYLGIIGAGIALLSEVFRASTPPGFPIFLLCLGSLFLGFANGFVNLFRFAAADAIPQKRSIAISVVLFGGDAAALIGPSLGVWLQGKWYHYGASYTSLAVLFFCTIVILFFIDLPELTKPDLKNAEPPRSIKELLKIPKLLLALTTATISFGMMVLLMVLIPLVMHDSFTVNEISHVLQIHSVGMFAPGLFVGLLIEKFGCYKIDFLGMIILASANLVMVFGENYWNFMLGMALLGVGWNFSFVSSTTLLTECYKPSEKATTQGVNDFVMYSVVSTLSLTAGWLWKGLQTWANLNFFSMAFCIFGMVSILITLVVTRKRDAKSIN